MIGALWVIGFIGTVYATLTDWWNTAAVYAEQLWFFLYGDTTVYRRCCKMDWWIHHECFNRVFECCGIFVLRSSWFRCAEGSKPETKDRSTGPGPGPSGNTRSALRSGLRWSWQDLVRGRIMWRPKSPKQNVKAEIGRAQTLLAGIRAVSAFKTLCNARSVGMSNT